MLEELNTLYVAFTRAVKSLNIYFAFNSPKSWPDYYPTISQDKLSLPTLLCNIGYEYMISKEVVPEQGLFHIRSSSYNADSNNNQSDKPADPVPIIYPVNLPYLSPRPEYQEHSRLPNLKQLWLEDAHLPCMESWLITICPI
jgi:ATP-dependent exoDNAse (exonuclease V) beta subunit